MQQPKPQQLSVQAQKEKDRLKAQREGQLNKKELALNKLTDEEVIVQLKAKGLGMYGTKQEKLDRLKKANGIDVGKLDQPPQIEKFQDLIFIRKLYLANNYMMKVQFMIFTNIQQLIIPKIIDSLNSSAKQPKLFFNKYIYSYQ